MSSSGWEVRFSNSRQLPYFYNSTTSTSIWEKPEELSEDQAQLLPGSQYLKGTTNAAAAAASNGASSLSSAPTNVTANGTVRASHLLVKHSQSRRPSSWKESNITRSPQEAEEILLQHAATLGPTPTPDQFASLAKVHSDCSSAAKGGDLGPFTRGQMQKPFEDATFGLPVGAMSQIIKTDSGYHLILRTA